MDKFLLHNLYKSQVFLRFKAFAFSFFFILCPVMESSVHMKRYIDLSDIVR